MLVNVPNADDLNEIALRVYFDAWERSVTLISDFVVTFDLSDTKVDGEHAFKEEWQEYVVEAQSEMGAICATIQQSSELRLKAIICETSPYLLLLNGAIPLKASQEYDLDFSEQKTLDAIDLPNAIRTLTEFNLSNSYVERYGDMRRLRNQVAHLGVHKGGLTPHKLIKILGQQYASLWPDGRWLYRRVQFDGNSARRFFHDQRWSSVESEVMAELPYTMSLLDNQTFKKIFGVAKGKLKGFCPSCMYARARKYDADGHATAYQTGSSSATCAMCEQELVLQVSSDSCDQCGSNVYAEAQDETGLYCFACGDG